MFAWKIQYRIWERSLSVEHGIDAKLLSLMELLNVFKLPGRKVTPRISLWPVVLQMRAAVQGIMRRRKQKPEELGVVELVSFGHLICGLSSSEISHLDPTNLRLEEETFF